VSVVILTCKRSSLQSLASQARNQSRFQFGNDPSAAGDMPDTWNHQSPKLAAASGGEYPVPPNVKPGAALSALPWEVNPQSIDASSAVDSSKASDRKSSASSASDSKANDDGSADFSAFIFSKLSVAPSPSPPSATTARESDSASARLDLTDQEKRTQTTQRQPQPQQTVCSLPDSLVLCLKLD
jgi:hypothetical protein